MDAMDTCIFGLFLLSHLFIFLRGEEVLPPTPEECCEAGRGRALRGYRCSIPPLVSASHVCRIIQEQCCVRASSDQRCTAGITMAMERRACEQPHTEHWDTSASKMCCDCCVLGLVLSNRGLACELGLSVGSQCEQAAIACCTKNETATHPAIHGPLLQTPSTPVIPHKEAYSCRESNCSQLCLGNAACGCLDGYRLKLDGINCDDIDECVMSSHNCGPAFQCTNTAGSFRCHPKERCSAGFIQDTAGTCIDIDECLVKSSPCPAGQTCVNTLGSYTCRRYTISCGRGYHLNQDGTRCEDVDECRGGGVCGGHGCVNVMGSYRCECQRGFTVNSLTKLCQDINECSHYPGRLCAQTCDNTEGSYLCSCTKGFQLSQDGRNCEDINECEANPCSQECANVYGSYQCYCNRGYQLSAVDGITCEDVDECALPIGGRLCAYRCSNAPGSFHCSCPPVGYTLAADGRTCQDIDECATGGHTCSGSQSCFNLQGDFRCLSFDCPSNFLPTSDGGCVRMTCDLAPDAAACRVLPLRISFYNVTFPAHVPLPAHVFRLGAANVAPGDDLRLRITSGDDEGYFGTERQARGGGVITLLRRPQRAPRDFLLSVEMTLIRYGTPHLYEARVAVFITQEPAGLAATALHH